MGFPADVVKNFLPVDWYNGVEMTAQQTAQLDTLGMCFLALVSTIAVFFISMIWCAAKGVAEIEKRDENKDSDE